MELICDSVWPELIDHWKGNPRYIAVAYFSNDEDLSFDENDLLIVDASDGAIKSGQTDAEALESAFESGAIIYSCPNLHAKVYVLGTRVFIGSANASQSSRNNLIECMVSSSDPHLISEAIKFIRALSEISEPVTHDFINRVSEIEVKRTTFSRANRVPLNISPSRCWLVGLYPEDYPGNEDEVNEQSEEVQQHLADEDEEVGWFWWPITHKSKFIRDAKVDDLLLTR